jgi:hypothetical protein
MESLDARGETGTRARIPIRPRSDQAPSASEEATAKSQR